MNKFAEYATNTALSFSLSKRQVEMLCACSVGLFDADNGAFMTTLQSLERKGLIARPQKQRPHPHKKGEVVYYYATEMTRAGEIMIELIKEAGLFVEYAPSCSGTSCGTKVIKEQ